MPSATQQIGNRGESIAKSFLEKQGYRCLERQWRCRAGEIDLVMQERDELVFVEVKYRASNDYGHPEEMVDWKKARRLTKTAFHYLRSKNQDHSFWRFDTVAITGNAIDHDIVHLKDTIRDE